MTYQLEVPCSETPQTWLIDCDLMYILWCDVFILQSAAHKYSGILFFLRVYSSRFLYIWLLQNWVVTDLARISTDKSRSTATALRFVVWLCLVSHWQIVCSAPKSHSACLACFGPGSRREGTRGKAERDFECRFTIVMWMSNETHGIDSMRFSSGKVFAEQNKFVLTVCGLANVTTRKWTVEYLDMWYEISIYKCCLFGLMVYQETPSNAYPPT